MNKNPPMHRRICISTSGDAGWGFKLITRIASIRSYASILEGKKILWLFSDSLKLSRSWYYLYNTGILILCPPQLSGWKYLLTLPVLHTCSQWDFRKIPLSQKVPFPRCANSSVPALILDFLVWVRESCTHGSYVTITFYSFLRRRISKVVPSHQLGTCCSPVPMVTKAGRWKIKAIGFKFFPPCCRILNTK